MMCIRDQVLMGGASGHNVIHKWGFVGPYYIASFLSMVYISSCGVMLHHCSFLPRRHFIVERVLVWRLYFNPALLSCLLWLYSCLRFCVRFHIHMTLKQGFFTVFHVCMHTSQWPLAENHKCANVLDWSKIGASPHLCTYQVLTK